MTFLHRSALCLMAAATAASAALAQPVNDDCASPIAVPPEGAVLTIPYPNDATPDIQTPDCFSSLNAPMIWYSYTAPADGRVDVTACNSNTYNSLSIWSDCDTLLYCNDRNKACPGDGAAALYGLPVSAGQTILIGLGIYPYFTGDTYLTVRPFTGPPAENDDCANATPITAGTYAISTGSATPAAAQAPCASGDSVGDIWYSYTPACTGFGSAFYEGGSLRYASIEVFDGCGGTLLGCNSGSGGPSQIVWAATQGVPYLIRIAGYEQNHQYESYGTGTLTVSCEQPVANDTCAGALPVTIGNNLFSNSFASTDGFNPCGDADVNDVYFSFTPEADVYLYTNTGYGAPNTSGLMTSLAVFEGCDGTLVACGSGAHNELPTLDWLARAGHTYIFRVASLPERTGTGSLFLRASAFPAVNDECSGAIPVQLGATTFDTTRFTAGAYTSDDPLACFGSPFPGGGSLWNNDLWYSYTPTEPGVIIVGVPGIFNAEIYDGCGGGAVACTNDYNFTPVGNDLKEGCFEGNVGQTYYIRIGQDFFTGGGVGQLHVQNIGFPFYETPVKADRELEACGNSDNNACPFDENPIFEGARLVVPMVGTLSYDENAGPDIDLYSIATLPGVRYEIEGQAQTLMTIYPIVMSDCYDSPEIPTIFRAGAGCRVGFSGSFVGTSDGRPTWIIVYNEDGGVSCAGANEYWFVVRPACAADFNDDGAADSQDFFDFIVAFFAAAPAADVNHDGFVNSQDFFDFLVTFFAGC